MRQGKQMAVMRSQSNQNLGQQAYRANLESYALNQMFVEKINKP